MSARPSSGALKPCSRLSLVGAGGTPEEIVAFKIAEGERFDLLRSGNREGFRDAPDQYFYLWAERDDGGYSFTSRDGPITTNAGRRLYANKALFEQSHAAAKGRLLKDIAVGLKSRLSTAA